MTPRTETFKSTEPVGDIVARHPSLSRLFERAGIDFCCGGRKPLEEACREKGIDARTFLAELETTAARDAKTPVVDVLAMSLAELADHVESTHHAYLHAELPRVSALASKVAMVHGGKDPRLVALRDTFLALVRDLEPHMALEEQVVFPRIRESGDAGPLADVVGRLESNHDRAGKILRRLRSLSDSYAPPEWACNTYRALLEALARIERDLHEHVHKENNVLFPRALAAQRRPPG